MPLRARWQIELVLGWLAITSCGCGAQHASVSGLVTFEGKPLTEKQAGLIVSFIGNDNKPVIGPVGADGQFQAIDVLLGENSVIIYWITTGQNAAIYKPKGNFDPNNPTPLPKEVMKLPSAPVGPIPTRYNDPNTSELKCNVYSGTNTFDIDLKSK